MAVRSRTEEYMGYRELRAAHEYTDEERLLHRRRDQVVNITPQWLDIMHGIRVGQRQIVADLQKLELLQKERLKVKVGRRDEEAEEAEISNVAKGIADRFRTAERDLDQLEAYFREEMSTPEGTQSELQILHNVKMCIANELNGLSRLVRDSQRRYMRNLEKQKLAQIKWAGADKRKELEDRMNREAAMDEFISRGCTQEQIDAIMLSNNIVEERDVAITKILESIRQLNEMFKDLNTMVIEQGTVLDRIDYNMTLTHKAVSGSKVELLAAQKHAEAGTFKICVLLLIVLIIGFTLAVMVKLIS